MTFEGQFMNTEGSKRIFTFEDCLIVCGIFGNCDTLLDFSFLGFTPLEYVKLWEEVISFKLSSAWL